MDSLKKSDEPKKEELTKSNSENIPKSNSLKEELDKSN